MKFTVGCLSALKTKASVPLWFPLFFGLGFILTEVAAQARAAGPPVTRMTLDNGARLLVSEQRAVPAVIVDVLVDAGARLDPVGREGLANLAADLLTEGTETRSAEEISEAADFIGASLSSSAEMDYAALRVTALRKDLDIALDLLADCLLRPSFPAKEIERRREAILASMKAAEDRPGVLASRMFRRRLFGSEPYGHPVDGWPESVARIKAGEIRDFYRRWYRPGRSTITVVGDIDAATAKDAVEKRLSAWSGGDAAAFVYPPAGPAAASVTVVEKPLSQANIVLGHRGLARTNPDFYAVTVMNYILGGGAFSSRLFSSIRTEAGLAYSVASFFTANKDPGSFEVVMQTKSTSAREAVARARAEIDRMRREPVAEPELAEAKQYLTGSFPLRFDTNAEIAGFLGQVEFMGLGDDYADKYAERINAVTAADVLRVAQAYLRPEELLLIVAGNSSETGIAGTP